MFANFLDCLGPLIFEFSNLLCILVGGIVDRTFQVGSPPSSSGGSIGSESERIHRALILGGIEQDGLVLNMSDHENRSPEVGSAVSALGASSGGSSINGNKF